MINVVLLIISVLIMFLIKNIILSSIACGVTFIVCVIKRNDAGRIYQVSLIISIALIGVLILMIANGFFKKTVDHSKELIINEKIDTIKKSAQIYYTTNTIYDSKITFTCDGKKCAYDNVQLEDLKEVPQSGTISIDRNGNISGENLKFTDYTCSFEGTKEPSCN